MTFDLDANGILNVSAKDKATGKEQRITITASSGLAKDEVERLVKEAEAHAEEDARKREQIEARNIADTSAYQAEKTLGEFSEQIDAELKSEVEARIADVRSVLAQEDADAASAERGHSGALRRGAEDRRSGVCAAAVQGRVLPGRTTTPRRRTPAPAATTTQSRASTARCRQANSACVSQGGRAFGPSSFFASSRYTRSTPESCSYNVDMATTKQVKTPKAASGTATMTKSSL